MYTFDEKNQSCKISRYCTFKLQTRPKIRYIVMFLSGRVVFVASFLQVLSSTAGFSQPALFRRSGNLCFLLFSESV